MILLGSPGDNATALTLASNTTLLCADKTAGLALARKYCSGGDTPGAACTSSTQCHSGSCVTDSGGPFAPNTSSAYGVVNAASSSVNVAIRNCGIWTNQDSGDFPVLGGAGKRWGYCDGAGTSITGEGCMQTCNAASGATYGLNCTTATAALCTAGGGACIDNAGTCSTLGGTCGAGPVTFGASGGGKINPIDFSASTDGGVISNVTIYDHRRGEYGFTSGAGLSALTADVRNKTDTLTTPQVTTPVNYPASYHVDRGVIAAIGSSVTRAQAYGWVAGMHALGLNAIADCSVGASCDTSDTTCAGGIGLEISYYGTRVHGLVGLPNTSLNTTWIGTLALFGDGFNYTIDGARMDYMQGPKFVVQGSGNEIVGIRGAWNGSGSCVSLGDPRGRCAGGSRSGRVCIFGAPTSDTALGCPSSTCNAHADFPASGGNHLTISGGLIHSANAGASWIRTVDSKRCSDNGRPCTVDGDCSGGSVICDFLQWNNIDLDGLEFYSASGATALELNTSSIGVTRTAGPSILNWVVGGDFTGFSTGFEFPAISRVCSSGTGSTTNNGTACTVASDCTCTGTNCVAPTCSAPVSGFVGIGNMSAVTTPFVNWDQAYGDVDMIKGQPVGNDFCQSVTLTAGAALTRGQFVSVSSGAATTAIVTTTANPERAIGTVMATVLNATPVKVCTSGAAVCIADGTITRGDFLKISGSTAGRVVSTSSATDLLDGVALESTTSGNTFKCLVNVAKGAQNTGAAFPKFAESHNGSTTALLTTYVELVTAISYTATSGKSIRIQALAPMDNTGGTARTATVALMRGGSNCTTGSPTTLLTIGTTSTGSTNTVEMPIQYTDTGQSGSVTYRLCGLASSSTAVQADAGASLMLTEY